MEMKVNLAKSAGVTLTTLEPIDADGGLSDTDGDYKSNFNPRDRHRAQKGLFVV